jgi:DNA-binding CsgD family transcriptional regulator
VILEPLKQPEIPAAIVQVHGLSRREGDVCLLVMRGFSTADIAERLDISSHTVQDHLKSIFDKVGVRSRRELVGQIFFDHYWPLHERQADRYRSPQ